MPEGAITLVNPGVLDPLHPGILSPTAGERGQEAHSAAARTLDMVTTFPLPW